MAIYQIKAMVDGSPAFEVPVETIWGECKVGGGVQVLDPVEYITTQQRKWYKGICLRELAKHDENGETVEWWDTEVKKECGGLKYLKKEIFFFEDGAGGRFGVGRLTTKGVGKHNMTSFIEEILSKSIAKGWPVSPPIKELRRT